MQREKLQLEKLQLQNFQHKTGTRQRQGKYKTKTRQRQRQHKGVKGEGGDAAQLTVYRRCQVEVTKTKIAQNLDIRFGVS